MQHAQPTPASIPTATTLLEPSLDNPPAQRAYSPPAIIFRARLEATAAFCGDAPNGKAFGTCGSDRTINS